MSHFTITITEKMDTGGSEPILRYSQTLDAINLAAIIAAANTKPPRVRIRNRAKAGPQNTPKRAQAKMQSLGLLSEEAK